MNTKIKKANHSKAAALLVNMVIAFSANSSGHIIDHKQHAIHYYGNDAAWYLDNIPFFECSDSKIQDVYYYRWKSYKSHIRNIGMDHPVYGGNSYLITEFTHYGGIEPWGSINCATGMHIYEGRWLKDHRYLDGYIDYMYSGAGNNRIYCENIADATYARYMVNADSSFVQDQLTAMRHVYNLSYLYFQELGFAHFDHKKGLYAIRPCNDATEASLASLEATSNKDVFGGNSFRPTINSYMYANALAIANIAAMKNQVKVSQCYISRAAEIKASLQNGLWNESMCHFMDRHFINNEFVKYWDFIQGRELAGFVPWQFNLPDNTPKYNSAWKHLMDTNKFMGEFGLRTVEPSNPYYMIRHQGIGCEWNGPSWPYHTTQVLTAMANLLTRYDQSIITISDYLKVLRQYTAQHFYTKGAEGTAGAKEGALNLMENYHPDTGKPIMDSDHSSHYNHSEYIDLIITGLCGIHPSTGDSLEIQPLLDNSITYFCLSDVQYHGHNLTIVYDADGRKYHLGKGLTFFVDGKRAAFKENKGKFEVAVGKAVVIRKPEPKANHALNLLGSGYPSPSASVNNTPESLYPAIDGRNWYFPEITNRWTTIGSKSPTDWYAIDFDHAKPVSQVNISFYDDQKCFGVPDGLIVEYNDGQQWLPVKEIKRTPAKITGNTMNVVVFNKVTATRIRVIFQHKIQTSALAVAELECY